MWRLTVSPQKGPRKHSVCFVSAGPWWSTKINLSWQSQSRAEFCMLMFQTDKGQYKAGDKVRIRLLLHDNFLRKVSYFYDCTMHIYLQFTDTEWRPFNRSQGDWWEGLDYNWGKEGNLDIYWHAWILGRFILFIWLGIGIFKWRRRTSVKGSHCQDREDVNNC